MEISMRKLIVSEFMSMDGVILGWPKSVDGVAMDIYLSWMKSPRRVVVTIVAGRAAVA